MRTTSATYPHLSEGAHAGPDPGRLAELVELMGDGVTSLTDREHTTTIDGHLISAGQIIGRRASRHTYRIHGWKLDSGGQVAWVTCWGGVDGPGGQHAGWHAISPESVRMVRKVVDR